MTKRKPKNNPPSKPKENHVLKAEPVDPEEKLAQIISAEYRESFFSGPLPPPEILQRYNEIVPGSAKQIVDIFDAQAKHRMELEKKVISGDSIRAYIGLGCGFAVCVATFFLAYMLIIRGNPISGALLSGGSLVGLVSVFVYGTQTRKQERVEKEEIRRKGK